MNNLFLYKYNLKELFLFSFVGVIGFIVDSSILILLVQLRFNPYLGRIVSFFIAASCTWLLNRNLTFRTNRTFSLLKEWLKYLMANSVGAVLNYGVYAILLFKVPLVGTHPVLGVAAGSVAGLFANYTNSRLFVFRVDNKKKID